jgi:hypothetical protein
MEASSRLSSADNNIVHGKGEKTNMFQRGASSKQSKAAVDRSGILAALRLKWFSNLQRSNLVRLVSNPNSIGTFPVNALSSVRNNIVSGKERKGENGKSRSIVANQAKPVNLRRSNDVSLVSNPSWVMITPVRPFPTVVIIMCMEGRDEKHGEASKLL